MAASEFLQWSMRAGPCNQVATIKADSIIDTYSEAVVERCSPKKVFLEILQNWQENTCARWLFLVTASEYCKHNIKLKLGANTALRKKSVCTLKDAL